MDAARGVTELRGRPVDDRPSGVGVAADGGAVGMVGVPVGEQRQTIAQGGHPVRQRTEGGVDLLGGRPAGGGRNQPSEGVAGGEGLRGRVMGIWHVGLPVVGCRHP